MISENPRESARAARSRAYSCSATCIARSELMRRNLDARFVSSTVASGSGRCLGRRGCGGLRAGGLGTEDRTIDIDLHIIKFSLSDF